MKSRLIAVFLALALGAGYSLTASAQAKPETLVKQREAAMTLMGKYFGQLAGVQKGKVPYNADMVKRDAAFLDALSKMPWDGFQPGTAEVKSRALPAVFKESAKFKQASEHLQLEIGQLVSAAGSGNEAMVKTAIGSVGKACAACHDNFRRKQQ